ncbi:MAG: putative bifunctional diguanylate cyclase/phosphodiesterase [Acidimicrobiia bacterium]
MSGGVDGLGRVSLMDGAPDGGGAPVVDAARVAPGGFSPNFLAYVVGPIALVMLLVFRHFGLVAKVSPWLYAAVVLGPEVTSHLVGRWPDAPRGSLRLHVRVVVHVVAVTSVVYLSGWGPALGMAFAFSALADLQQSGAGAWRAALGWSLVGCAVGQLLVLEGWAPSFLSGSQAQTIGFLGAFVFGIAIRMAGAVGEHTEHADALLEEQMIQASRARDDARRSRDDARRSEAHHRAVVENAAEGILTIGLDGTICSFNTAAEAMFGWTATEMVGNPVARIVPRDLHVSLVEFLQSYESIGDAPAQTYEVEITGVHKDGTLFPMMVSTSAIVVDGSPPLISGILRDLSDQKRFEAQLSHKVVHDPLTGLANRVRLTDWLGQALGRVRRHGHMCGVLYVDLDRFKAVNDTLGHAAGDQLLIETATRIRASVRETDTVARLGGDEFVVLCEDIDGVQNATDLAQRIIAGLQASYRLGDDDVHVSASIGIAFSTDGTESAETLLTNADIAMYRAKTNGRSRAELFDEAMQQWVTTQLALETALRQAVPRKELRLFGQPIVDADTGIISGFEALVRWERPGHGLVAPDLFIPAAEETGLIVDIGAWVLDEACRHAAFWAQRWPDHRLDIAVNVSGRQLLTSDFVDTVTSTLARTGLDPTLLTLELTESVLIDDALSVEPLLHRLRALGVNLALDDFGTGYSSLTYLRAFPINIVKIDKSFIRAIGTEREDTAIVAAVIGLANNLGIDVVAEGVEQPEQLAVLHQLGCPRMQGYLFSPPVPIREAPNHFETPHLAHITPNAYP